MAGIIFEYQTQRNKKSGVKVFLDGRVDSVRSDKSITSITHTRYTIIALQSSYLLAVGKNESKNLEVVLRADTALHAYPHVWQELFRKV